jgi:2-keto-4-pentenoate hydratase/2-oxohepta-3-ene-1,7-dioic acid hydratase in catechol pathway
MAPVSLKWGRIEVDGAPLKVVLHGDRLVAADGRSFPLAAAKLLPPVVPGNFYAAGLNFRAHIEWANRYRGTAYPVPTQADIGYRSNNALLGSGGEIVIPADSTGPVEYEGELVAVIGRKAKNVSESEALDVVAGFTLGNDVSERSWQRSDRTLWRAKNADTFKPMGPFVASGIDPMNQDIEVRINGRTVSRYSTRGMIFGVAQYISRISRYLTLHPDDVIWFGCDGHTVPALQDDDVVEVASDAIGVLANRVRREKQD